jgi:hypothetical protein
MPLGRILPRPSGTVPAQPAYAARVAQPSLAQLGRCERARGGAARACGVRCGGDLTGAQEVAGESTVRPHRRVDGGATELVGVDDGTRAARRFGGDL